MKSQLLSFIVVVVDDEAVVIDEDEDGVVVEVVVINEDEDGVVVGVGVTDTDSVVDDDILVVVDSYVGFDLVDDGLEVDGKLGGGGEFC